MPRPDQPVLGHLFEEAKSLLQTQRELLAALDERAAELLRFNILVVGVTATGVWFLTDRRSGRLLNSDLGLTFLTIGFLLLAGSTVFAILSHRAERIGIGLHEADLATALDYDVSERGFLAEAVRSYSRGIAENAKSRDRTVIRLQWAAWLALGAVVTLSLAAISLSVGGLP